MKIDQHAPNGRYEEALEDVFEGETSVMGQQLCLTYSKSSSDKNSELIWIVDGEDEFVLRPIVCTFLVFLTVLCIRLIIFSSSKFFVKFSRSLLKTRELQVGNPRRRRSLHRRNSETKERAQLTVGTTFI